MAQQCILCLPQVLLEYRETMWILSLRMRFPLLIMQPSSIRTSWILEICTGTHISQKNPFRRGAITDLTALPHSNLNSRKSAGRASEGVRGKIQSPQAEMDLQATSSRLVEHLHVVLQTLEGSKGSRTGQANSQQIVPLRIIKYRKPTNIQKTFLYSEGHWTKGIEWEGWENTRGSFYFALHFYFHKKHSFGQYRRQLLKYNRPLVWYSVDLPSYTRFWSIGSQNRKKALQWADDVRLWWNKQCELPTPHTGSERSVFLHSAFSEL